VKHPDAHWTWGGPDRLPAAERAARTRRECPEGSLRYRAELVAVAGTADELVRQPAGADLLQNLVEQLRPGEVLAFEYRGPEPDASPRATVAVETWRGRGRTTGRPPLRHTQPGQEEASGPRPRAFREIVTSNRVYVMRIVEAAAPRQRPYRRGTRLTVPAVLLQGPHRGPIGFRPLPHPPRRRPASVTPAGWWSVRLADLVLTTLAPSPRSSLWIEISPIRLQADARDTVARCLDRLAKGRLAELLDEGDALDVELVADLRRTLEGWLRVGAGYRLRIWIPAGPEALRWNLRRAIFRQPGGDRRAGLPGQATSLRARDVVDLTGCLPSCEPLPALLPVTEHGVALVADRLPGLPVVRLPAEGVRLGRTYGGVHAQEVRLPREDRSKHVCVLGATGTGKSTLLASMIRQDIEQGEGVCVIDPHGDLLKTIVASMPAARAADVVHLRPGDRCRTFGLNLLESVRPGDSTEANRLCNELLAIFDQLYDLQQVGGPVFESYMRNAILLVMDDPAVPGTVVDVVRVFEDASFRHQLVARCRNRVVADFWRREADPATGELSLSAVTPYITSKLNQFVMNAVVRPIVGQRHSTVDFRAVLEAGRILLVDLSVGTLGPLDVRLLGMLVLAKLLMAALARSETETGRRRPMFVYVDESQLFATPTLADSLAGARKFGLYYTLATQNLSQLISPRHGDRLLETILGNVSTLLLFRLGPPDALRLEHFTRPALAATDLEMLPDHHVVCRLLAAGKPVPPFVFRAAPPPEPRPEAEVRAIITHGYAAYTRPVAEVEAALLEAGASESGTMTSDD